MRVIGIDPGLVTTGWAVVDVDLDDQVVNWIQYGSIKTRRKEGIESRLYKILRETYHHIAGLEPDHMAIERPMFASHGDGSAGIKVSQAHGAALCAWGMYRRLSEGKHEAVHYHASHIKKEVTGNGSAKKEDVKRSLYEWYPLKLTPGMSISSDEADAIAAATTLIKHTMAEKEVSE